VHGLAERVLAHIRRHQLLIAGDRVGVAVSGGIDSVALLRLLLELRGELGIVLSVVHFNHKLRAEESEADERFVAHLATVHQLEFFCDGDDVAEYASKEGVSVEAAARELRYGFFCRLLEGALGAKTPSSGGGSNRSAQSVPPPKAEPQTVATARLDRVVTGHTLDDQAETVLLRVIRGTGLSGVSGIHPRIVVEHEGGEISGEIIRPLLGTRRCELGQYLNDIGQIWREDPSNADQAFTRNRLRKRVLPLLEKEFNPAVAESLAELAEIARGEEEYWENEVAGWMGTAVHWVEPEWARPRAQSLIQIAKPGEVAKRSASIKIPISGKPSQKWGTLRHASDDLQARIDRVPWLVANASVSRAWLVSEPLAVQRRVVKAIGEYGGIPLEFKHVQEILHFAGEEAGSGKELSLPLGWKVVRYPEELLFVTPNLLAARDPGGYEHEISLPGRVGVPELHTVIEAQRVPADETSAYNPDELLDADSLRGPLKVRNWRAGDRFWPAHTKSPKKIKELLQERRLSQAERSLWPVIVCGDEIVWVRGFATHTNCRAKAGREAVWICDRPWSDWVGT
jgi:tRNA(Ile)-lysidine synthase